MIPKIRRKKYASKAEIVSKKVLFYKNQVFFFQTDSLDAFLYP